MTLAKTIDFSTLQTKLIEQQYLFAVTYNETAFRGLKAAYDMYYFYTLQDAQDFVRTSMHNTNCYIVCVPVVAQCIQHTAVEQV
jgi:hypothetical protein